MAAALTGRIDVRELSHYLAAVLHVTPRQFALGQRTRLEYPVYYNTRETLPELILLIA